MPREQEPIVSLPNLLTLVRLPMAVAVWLVAPWPWVLFGLMAAAAASDMLDGWFARRMRARRQAQGLPTRGLGEKGGRGAWLDPLCDKTFVVSVILAVWVFYDPPWWLIPLIGAREILLVPLVLAWRLKPGHADLDLRAGGSGKLATVMQFAALWSILLGSAYAPAWGVVSAVIGLVAVFEYAWRGVKEKEPA
ncbi:MAG: CDP-alcohol phosphatidyltransferase family protein [Planctomycetes bacterium]|nr:CDP-alcohol phosphatidyltransferase family protein [Planctomycetota bacterium]